MRLNLGLLSTVLLFSTTEAVNIRFYRLFTCDGNGNLYWTINNAVSNQCYYASADAGAVSFDNLPSGAKGQVYTGTSSSCTNYGNEAGSGNWCLWGTGNYRSANWFYSSKRLARNEELESLGPTRFSVTYELPDLTSREIEVPVAPGEIDHALKLIEERNYEELAEYPTYIKG